MEPVNTDFRGFGSDFGLFRDFGDFRDFGILGLEGSGRGLGGSRRSPEPWGGDLGDLGLGGSFSIVKMGRKKNDHSTAEWRT